MFSPAVKKSIPSSSYYKSNNKFNNDNSNFNNPDSPITPIFDSSRNADVIPNRPSTGTPAPWAASRLSVLARVPAAKKTDIGDVSDPSQPVFVGEFPQVARDEQQSILLQKRIPGQDSFSGGLDKESSLAWLVCGRKLFVWSYISHAAPRKCAVLDIPPTQINTDVSKNLSQDNSWLVYVVNWDDSGSSKGKLHLRRFSAGIILCNRKSRSIVYWPNIDPELQVSPQISEATNEEFNANFSPDGGKSTPSKHRRSNKPGGSLSPSSSFNSLIASAIFNAQNTCVALASSSDGELWKFICSPSGIQRERVNFDIESRSLQVQDANQLVQTKGYPRSLIWHFPRSSLNEPNRQFLFLTDHEIQCFSIDLSSNFKVSKLWSHEIVGTDADLGIQKDLAGQKKVWPVDLQVDDHGKVLTVLVAIFCKDRITSSSYTEYSLLTMQYKSGANISSDYSQPRYGNILEKKAPIQVIIPKARVENEEFLFSMRLKIGGNPAGSATILSGDGIATVSHFFRGSTRLYQFDLRNDAAKVLDTSVFPSDDREEGAWAILTEKAGIWAIPERAILLGGVEPPERSLSRKGSSNERSSDERKKFSFTSNIPPRRASSETWDSGDRPKAELTGIARRGAHDEESEALIGQLFHEFLLSGQVNAVYDKLKNSGAFERDGETNVFARTSKSIVDTLAKHWTTTRGAEIVSLSVLSTQLGEKQQKHQRFLQFLALSKCHEELSSRQRESLHTIMEHGEKLACMIQLRELQHLVSHNRASEAGSSYPSSESQVSGSLWDLIQLVGERARRNTVMLMDRENTEVFYSKVSDLQEVFYCLEKQLDCIINTEMPYPIQLRRACELSNACVTLLHTAMQYRNEHHMWYPSPEGLTPWFCQSVVRCGLWNMVSFMIQLSTETYRFDYETRLEFLSDLKALSEVLLEAYSGAITAKVDRGQEHKALLNEYWNRRDTLLDCLYQQVKGLADVQIQESKERSEGQYEEILETLSSGVLAIAKRHEGYQTLWNICSDLNDFELLRGLMHQGMGPKGGFSYFVFQQLHSTEQFSKLMRLGEEFPEELATFLKQHQDLFWLHEVFLHRFSSASESLHELALQRNESSAIVMDESHAHTEKKVSLIERKRFLKLSKIAALAGKDADYEAKVRRIDADLKILQLQEHILRVSPNIGENGNIEGHLLPPVDLIELCLKSQNRDLALLAFDVFAWTSRSFLKYNTDLLEECWRNAANQDNWEVLYERSTVEGWVEEETSCHLKDTVLFQASRRCYGPEAETFEGGFDEVLPLRQNSSGLSTMTDNSCSVEEILMQHRNFPDAGKLILTAVVMGSMPDGSRMDDEGPSPME